MGRAIIGILLIIFGFFGGLVAAGYLTITGIIDIVHIIQGDDGSVLWAVIKIIGADFVALALIFLSWTTARGLFKG